MMAENVETPLPIIETTKRDYTSYIIGVFILLIILYLIICNVYFPRIPEEPCFVCPYA